MNKALIERDFEGTMAEGTIEASELAAVYLGAQVRLRRNVLDLSRQQLGSRVGLTEIEMASLEHGEMTVPPDLIDRLAEALESQAAEFILCPEENEDRDVTASEAGRLLAALNNVPDTTVRHLLLSVAELAARISIGDRKR